MSMEKTQYAIVVALASFMTIRGMMSKGKLYAKDATKENVFAARTAKNTILTTRKGMIERTKDIFALTVMKICERTNYGKGNNC